MGRLPELAVVAVAVVTALALIRPAVAAEAGPAIVGIKVLPDALRIRTTGRSTAARIVELRAYEREASAPAAAAIVWAGSLGAGEITVPRFADGCDRLYRKFQLVDSATGRALGLAHWPDDLAALPAWNQALPWPASKKGVSCPVDLEDLKTLGVTYTDFGVVLAGIFDWTGGPPAETWTVDGQELPINVTYIRDLDRQIKRMTELGINVTLIPVNGVPAQPDPANPLINPATDLPGTPNHIGTFNLTDERGLRFYRGAFEYLAQRYSDPAGEHGWVSGYVVGNEVQSHWYWHNSGLARGEDVARDYAGMLRVAWLAVRRFHSSVRVYASLDHFWTARADANPLKSMPGRELLERLNETIGAEGNFPWNVAFHPYPEDLAEPRFWNDQTAGLGFDSPRVTFKNLEVLPAFLAQERFLYQGVPRRIILSEQGFNCPDNAAGETIQAAAYAAAHYKISHMPAIDAFILHRHVDHRDEGGLHMGIWTRKLTGDDPTAPDRRRLLHEVFRRADSDRWQEAFEFAKPIVGIKDWAEMLPSAAPIPADCGRFAPPLPADRVVCNLLDLADAAKVSNCLDWRQTWAKGADGRVYPALFHHPPSPEKGSGEAAFTIALPVSKPGARLVLQVGTVVTGPSTDGVGMAIAVAGRDLWAGRQTVPGQPADHSVDLSAFAGQTVTMILRVDALGNNTGDWANWLRPVILIDPAKDGTTP
jgi:hypothetical protein